MLSLPLSQSAGGGLGRISTNKLSLFKKKIAFKSFHPAAIVRPSSRRHRSSCDVQAAMIPPLVISPWAAAACAVGAWAAFKVLSFARAYGDLTLMSKRRPPADAFRGKVVWIVGASQGLGEALALHFAAAGARLVLSSRSLDKLEAVKRACMAHLPEVDVALLPLDLTAPYEALESAADAAFAAFGAAGIDYCVHNAGASQHAAVEETDHDVAAKLIALNLLGPIALARATLPQMLQQGRGRHVVVASMSAVVPSPGQAVYAAAKSGLVGYFSSLTTELADRGVGATVCCPGPLATGAEGQPRVVFGPRGLIQQASTGLSKKRVPVELAAELIARAAYYELDEAWIAFHPVLLMGYLMQYAPAAAGMKVLKKIGPGRARQLRDGSGTGYDVKAMFSSSKRTQVGDVAVKDR